MKSQNMVSLAYLLNNEDNQMRVDVLDIHPRFHTDEGAAHWIAKSESFREKVGKKFPRIWDATIRTWALGQALAPEEKAHELALGCLGGRADEHTLKGEQFQNTSSAAIFAKLAGINDDPALDALLERVIREDRHGGSNGDSVHKVLKQIHRMQTPPELQEILDWVSLVYEAQYQTYKKDGAVMRRGKVLTLDVGKEMITNIFSKEKAEVWVELGRRAMKNHAKREDAMHLKLSKDQVQHAPEFWSSFTVARLVKNAKGELVNIRDEEHQMVVIETNSMEVMKPAVQLGASLVIIKSLDGKIAILADQKKKIDLTNVCLALRQEELDIMKEKGDKGIKQFHPNALRVVGHVEKWPGFRPYWYLHAVPRTEKDQLYCGSEAASMVPSSEIPLDRIVKILKLVLGRKFHPHFFKGCLNGRCAGRECPWYEWELVQCGITQGEVKLAEKEMQPA